MRKLLQKLETALRGLCGRITPERRIVVIAVLLVVFAAVNIGVTFSAIYRIGREDRRVGQIRITPLTVPEFVPEQGTENDFKHFNTEENDTTQIESEF